MTPEGFKKHKDLIEAWADGAEIEEYKYFAGWTPMQEGEPAWSETITPHQANDKDYPGVG